MRSSDQTTRVSHGEESAGADDISCPHLLCVPTHWNCLTFIGTLKELSDPDVC